MARKREMVDSIIQPLLRRIRLTPRRYQRECTLNEVEDNGSVRSYLSNAKPNSMIFMVIASDTPFVHT